MSATVEIRLDPALQELIRRGPQSAVLAAIARALDHENEETIAVARAKRMKFPPPPAKTTLEGTRFIKGGIFGRMNRSAARVVGDSVISAIGNRVRHYGYHEFGGTFTVPEHYRRGPRRFQDDGGSIVSLAAAARAGSLTKAGAARKKARLTEIAPERVKVRTHKITFPARRMVQRTLEERQRFYNRRIEKEVAQAVGGPGGTAA